MEEVLAKNDLADGKNGQQREMIRSVPLSLIDDFPEHPFKVKDDEEMEKLKDSISLYGVLTPVVARRCENGRYELISGHRRKYACKALGIEFIPAIVREIYSYYTTSGAVVQVFNQWFLGGKKTASSLARQRLMRGDKSPLSSFDLSTPVNPAPLLLIGIFYSLFSLSGKGHLAPLR